MDIRNHSNNELVRYLAQHPRDENAWAEFLRRFHEQICCTIHRECKRIGHNQGAAHAQDLAQEVYKKLLRNNCRALREFRGQFENSIVKYLHIVAIRVAQNDYRKDTAKKRPSSGRTVSIHEPRWYLPDEHSVDLNEIIPSQEWARKVGEFEIVDAIERCLQKILQGQRHGPRDKLIIKYYLYDGQSAEDIGTFPDINLSSQRVFGIIAAVKRKLQRCLAENN